MPWRGRAWRGRCMIVWLDKTSESERKDDKRCNIIIAVDIPGRTVRVHRAKLLQPEPIDTTIVIISSETFPLPVLVCADHSIGTSQNFTRPSCTLQPALASQKDPCLWRLSRAKLHVSSHLPPQRRKMVPSSPTTLRTKLTSSSLPKSAPHPRNTPPNPQTKWPTNPRRSLNRSPSAPPKSARYPKHGPSSPPAPRWIVPMFGTH